MQVRCSDGLGQVLRSCTRVEAHLALVKFRPHSILHRGIKTQTWLLLWRIIDNTLILPSSPHEWWDAETPVFVGLFICTINRLRWLKWVIWQRLFKFCEKFSLLKIPVTKHAKERVHMQQRSSVIPTGKGTSWMNVFRFTFQRLDWMSYMSPKASGATDCHDTLSTIFWIMKVFRQFVVHIDGNGKMPEAVVDLFHQAYFPGSV